MGRRRRTRPGTAADQRAPQLAGHEMLGPVGFGTNGAVWSARDGAGNDVVVSVLALPAGQAGAARLRRLAALRLGTHPHLARIRQVSALDAGRCAVVSDRVPGPTLATVVAARGRLAPAELAALLTGIGSALGHLHERGVVHGDVAPANVIVAADGVPVLVDLAGHGAHELGTAGFVAPERGRGSAAGAPGDVWALARLLVWAAGPDPDARLVRVLGPALDVEPSQRPAARDLASRAPEIGPAGTVTVPPAAVLAQARMRDDLAPTRRRPATRRRRQVAAAPTPRRRSGSTAQTRDPAPAGEGSTRKETRWRPVRTADAGAPGAPVPEPPRAGRHTGPRKLPARWLGAALSLGVAALLVGLIVWSAPGERAGGYGHRQATATQEVQRGEVLAELLARRDGALVAGDAAALAATTVAGGPAAREDAALLERLQTTGTELEHLRTEVVGVSAVTPLPDGTAVDVVLAQAAHERVVDDERVTVPAPEPRCARVVLVAGTGGSWQILRSEPCP